MENYKCAYRDLNSPLTPIPPMADNAFDFSKAATALLASTNRGGFKTPTNSLPVPKAVHFNSKNTPSPSPQTEYFYSSKTKITVNNINCNPCTNASNKPRNAPACSQMRIRQPPSARNSVTSVKESVHCKMGDGFTYSGYKESYKEMDGRQTRRQVTYEQRVVRYKSVPPRSPQPLCSKMAAVLHDLGLTNYESLFQHQEIDFAAFMLLDEKDLDELGIYERRDRELLLDTIDFYNECEQGY